MKSSYKSCAHSVPNYELVLRLVQEPVLGDLLHCGTFSACMPFHVLLFDFVTVIHEGGQWVEHKVLDL